MKEWFKNYGILTIIVIVCSSVVIGKVINSKHIEERTYQNCIASAEKYMDEKIKDFHIIDKDYNYHIDTKTFKREDKGYSIYVKIMNNDERVENFKIKFTEKISEDRWNLKKDEINEKIQKILSAEKQKHDPVNIAIKDLYEKEAKPLLSKGYKADCNLLRNGYEQTNTVLWILNYRKNNSIIEHQRRYTIEVYKDGTYSIVEKEEV